MKIDNNKLLLLTGLFIVFTVIGTVSHELGHIAVAKWFDYKTTLHYGSMEYKDSPLYTRFMSVYAKNQTAIQTGYHFVDDAEYLSLFETLKWQSLLIRMGGPVQTMLTGIIGIFLIFAIRTHRRIEFLIKDWFAVFLALFWLREIFNLFMSVAKEIISPDGNYFGRGDEFYISVMLKQWTGTVPVILGMLGLIISVFIVFKVVPRELRLTFITSGIIGGISGYILWFEILGPIVLP